MTRSLALLLMMAATPAAAEPQAQVTRLTEPAGVALLLRPQGVADPPLVAILPDALGADRRTELYVVSLLARGIASLTIGLGEDLESGVAAVEPAASPDAVPPVLAWAREAGFAPERIALLGFGLGGRAALVGARGLPTVALYPGCASLPLPVSGPALILQGGDAADGCAELALPRGVSLRLLHGVGHGWDAPGAFWPPPGPMLPDPAGGGLLRARTDGEATREAAETVAEWLEERLLGGVRRVAR